MRLIINDAMLYSKKFNSLTKEQIIFFFKISSKFAENNSTEITSSEAYMCAVYEGETEDFRVLVSLGFISVNDKQLTLVEAGVTFFKNNNVNVKKCLDNKKIFKAPVSDLEAKTVEFIKEVPETTKNPVKVAAIKQPAEDRTDWDLIKTKFNDMTNGTTIAKVMVISPNRQKATRSVYKLAKSLKDPTTGESYEFGSFEDFIDQYLSIISQRKGLRDGWPYNGKQFTVDWDFLFNQTKFINIIEKNQYK